MQLNFGRKKVRFCGSEFKFGLNTRLVRKWLDFAENN